MRLVEWLRRLARPRSDAAERALERRRAQAALREHHDRRRSLGGDDYLP